ncbi:MAG: hypothetical protein ACI9XK_004998 [Granulosicoccus sp.]|jgi:hypothetical protein
MLLDVTVDASTILTSVLEVSIGIAGFSGIVAALGSRARKLSAEARLYLRVLLTASFLCILSSFLPLLLEAGGITGSRVWTIPSTVWVSLFFGVIVFRIYESRKAPSQFLKRPVIAMAAVLGASATALCLANIFIIQSAWPYLVTTVLILFAGAFSFVALLYELIAEEEHD